MRPASISRNESDRRLLLMRHAEAESPLGVPDRERPLSRRGRSDCASVATALATRDLRPDCVVVSPARRARETWEHLRGGLGSEPAASTDERLYARTVEDLLAVIHETPDDYDTLLIVGHNPAIELLARHGGGPLVDRFGGIPTATVCAYALEEPWAAAALETARPLDVIAPGRSR